MQKSHFYFVDMHVEHEAAEWYQVSIPKEVGAPAFVFSVLNSEEEYLQCHLDVLSNISVVLGNN